jgi:hypothetical protein
MIAERGDGFQRHVARSLDAPFVMTVVGDDAII